MSINIDWEALTGGPDGQQLAETILEFINGRFQKVTLPKFIRSVQAHSFEFGDIAPTLELKDVCDPLDDFYETDDDNDDDDDDNADDEDDDDHQHEDGSNYGHDHHDDHDDNKRPHGENVSSAAHLKYSSGHSNTRAAVDVGQDLTSESLKHLDEANRKATGNGVHQQTQKGAMPPPASLPFRLQTNNLQHGTPAPWSPQDPLPSSAQISRSSTPAIPGGTSNLSYFHLPLSGGLSGSASNAFASMAGGQFASSLIDHHNHHQNHRPGALATANRYVSQSTGVSTRTANAAREQSPPPTLHLPSEPSTPAPNKDVNDVQIVARVRYSGNIRLSLTADILLDYPMPSFVGIPLKLNVTGLTFDGVAILAYIKKKAHFCFLSPEDAEALVGRDTDSSSSSAAASSSSAAGAATAGGQDAKMHSGKTTRHKLSRKSIGGLLEEIKVESEIGQKEPGKQVLKNVGKVEKFILQQVRRIFEKEFVYPSFWTFLV